ncbi:molybdate ABC transporter substrate-binding protein [Stieleria varia]|uniref:Putative binding protein n=1 Tax=Stieleria varia TaxID=2528005 RepID=A0A5C6B4T5_9BACT|nr:molybdate ABC transporter substrate-binding protein [Stieleria varia]TWU06491.1 putative binding protein precursor [Stieleria varia]
MNRALVFMIGSAAVLAAIFAFLVMSDSGRSRSTLSSEPLLMYCAASNRAVMESIRQDYEKEFHRSIEIQYGPSQTLLSSIEVTRTGDLYLPADDSYLKLGREKELIAETLPIASMRAVVAVRKDNPLAISRLDDLLDENVRLVQANPDTAAIGKVVRKTLTASGRWSDLDQATMAYRATVNEVANDVSVGAADAGIVYDAVLHTYTDLTYVKLPELDGTASDIAVGVLQTAKDSASALHFARYIAASDRGLVHYREHGFRVGAGDQWSDRPELSVFAGSMLRPAIEETITAFEKREGVNVTRVYNGCGNLVAQMKAGQRPDAYFACDSEFMDQVHDLFPEPVPVSQNELVILVPKGNPKGIRSLRDLTRPGLEIGIGHEKQCAMGWLTQNTFREGGVQESIMPNVKVQSPTGDMLVNQMQAGSLDAAVAYLSNAAGASESLDAIRITGLECSVATQPWAVAKESKYPQLAGRLFERICSAESQQVFAAEGFRWQELSSKASSDPVSDE